MKWLMMVVFLTPGLAFADPATERLWKGKCAGCHGADGKGATEQGKKMHVSDMSTAEWQKEATDEKITAAINDGIKTEKNGVKQEMDAYKAKLKPEQIAALAAHVRTLKK